MSDFEFMGFLVEPTAFDPPSGSPLEAIVEAKRKIDAARRTVFVHASLVEGLRIKVEKEGLDGIIEVRPLPEGMPADKGYVVQREFNYRQRWISEPGDVFGGVRDE